MARTPKNLTIQQVASTTLTTIYTVPTKINTTGAVFSFTNVTTSNHSIDIYHNDGSTDFLIKTFALPGGSGTERVYWAAQRRTFNAGDAIKIQSNSASAFNVSLSGSEVEI
jgi:hypothetical protein